MVERGGRNSEIGFTPIHLPVHLSTTVKKEHVPTKNWKAEYTQ